MGEGMTDRELLRAAGFREDCDACRRVVALALAERLEEGEAAGGPTPSPRKQN